MFFTYGYLFYLPFNLLYFCFVIYHGIKRKYPYYYYLFSIVMAIYLNNVIKLVYFPILIESVDIWGKLDYYMDFSLNFREMGGARQILGNLFVTIPFGVLFPFLVYKMRNIHKMIIVIFSCGLELFQLVIIAIFHSVTLYFDIKDLILNLIGGLVGYWLFCCLAMIVRKYPGLGKNSEMFSYIYQRCASIKCSTSTIAKWLK